MSGGQTESSLGLKGLFKHVPHAATAIALEQALEFLIGGHGADFAQIRSQIEDLKWGPFRQAELNIKLWKVLKEDPDHCKDREKELLDEAYRCFHQSASVLNEEKRCKVLVSATVCAQFIGRYAEANALRKIALEELRAINEALFHEYNLKSNIAKRVINSNIKVSKPELGVSSALLFIAGVACPPFTVPALAVATLLCTATAAGKLTDDHERVAERLSATQRFGEDVFGGRWHGPRAVRRGIWNFASQPAT